MTGTKPQFQEAQRTPSRVNTKTNTTSEHIIIKLKKIKGKILKATREKQQTTYKRTPTRLSADFSTETLQARREWYDIFKVIKGKKLQSKILCPARFLFKLD